MRVLSVKFLSIVIDVAVVMAAFLAAPRFRFFLEPDAFIHFQHYPHPALLTALAFVAIGGFYVCDVYPNHRKFASFDGLILLWDTFVYVAVGQTLVVYFFGGVDQLGRGVFAWALAVELALFTLAKAQAALVVNQFGPKPKALVVGYNPDKRFYLNYLKKIDGDKLVVAGMVVDEASRRTEAKLPFRVLGGFGDVEALIEKQGIRVLVLTSDYEKEENLQDFLIMAHHNQINLTSIEGLYEETTGKVHHPLMDRTEFLKECLLAKKFAPIKQKRLFEFVLALAILVVCLPACLVAAALIKLGSPGPVFYFQERVGFRGRKFRMIKFRTMRVDAEKRTGAVLTQRDDVRIVPFGKWLRKTHFDELPQLLNVIRGDMSLVGPRPERRDFIEKLEKKIPMYSLRLFAKPGITGWAQVAHGYASTMRDLEEKFCYDLYYLKNMSIAFDVKILLRSVPHVLMARGDRPK